MCANRKLSSSLSSLLIIAIIRGLTAIYLNKDDQSDEIAGLLERNKQLIDENQGLRVQLERLAEESQKLVTTVEGLRDNLETQQIGTTSQSTSSLLDTDSPDSDTPEGGFFKLMEHAWEMSVNMQVQEIEDFVVISDAQREALREKFKKDFELTKEMWRTGGDVEIAESQLEAFGDSEEELKEILGLDKYEAYREQQEARWEKQQADQLDQQVFNFTRRLSLSPSQEEEVREVLQEVEEQSLDVWTDETSDPESENNPFDYQKMIESAKRYEEHRKEALNKRLRDVLTDDQFNKHLEQQAQESSLFPAPSNYQFFSLGEDR